MAAAERLNQDDSATWLTLSYGTRIQHNTAFVASHLGFSSRDDLTRFQPISPMNTPLELQQRQPRTR
ncbi:hypothetical protein CVT26_011527 [Gymnopilus dilepis]|uniref:Uncharacterized protein n=1 Tax=Gymnopilus dilepis TaxID=231916 RepID=A0A409W5P3_9AGAR|nr:hypothetical protein CVT26_011527 [Gymnopilus dilepis]